MDFSISLEVWLAKPLFDTHRSQRYLSDRKLARAEERRVGEGWRSGARRAVWCNNKYWVLCATCTQMHKFATPSSDDLSESLLDPRWGEAMFGAARTARFAAVLLGAARTLDGVVEVFAYQKQINGEIRTLAASGDRDGIGSRTQAYAQRFHAQDPIILARRSSTQSEGFVRRVQAQDIPAGDYRALCFEQPGFADKVTFGYRHHSSLLVLSFYRSTSGERTSLRPLVALGQVAMAALSYHAGDASSLRSQWSSPQQADQMLRARLARSFPALTLREQEVVARTLLGESATQIAAHLGIKSSSVLTYRLRAYGRFGFGQASDFLASVLS